MKGLIIHKVPPEYPESAKENNIQGTVVLRAVIGADGRIAELNPISGPAELIPPTISAVKQWEYRPYVLSGKPSEVETQITVNFTLSH
jgi:TonB family protein